MSKDTKKTSPFKPYLIISGIVLLLIFFLTYNPIVRQMTMATDVSKYLTTNKTVSNLPSRIWMRHALDISEYANEEEREDFAPAVASHFYAYVASIYADVLEKTNNEKQASIATANLIDFLYPDFKERTKHVMETILQGEKAILTADSQKILNYYIDRKKNDRSNLDYTKFFPKSNTQYYTRNGKRDKGARGGEWLPWILGEKEEFNVPPPPVRGSLEDKIDVEKVIYASRNRTETQRDRSYFWAGAGQAKFARGKALDNVTPAGVWINILFTEEGHRTDAQFAKAQKILAQTLDDAFIYTWRVKYKYMTQRPDMRIPHLSIAFMDPPFPGYTSGHATTSHAANTVLTYLFPDKKSLWEQLGSDARNSRLSAAIHMDSDQQIGEYYGKSIGDRILQKLYPKTYASKDYSSLKAKNSALMNQLLLWFMQTQIKTRDSIDNFLHSNIGRGFWVPPYQYGGPAADTSNSNLFQAATWADYDNDGYLDLYVRGNLYRNQRNNSFLNVTSEAGLPDMGNMWGIRIFGDYQNDGCPDMFEARYDGNDENLTRLGIPQKLYKNNCDGSYVDVTEDVGIKKIDYHGRAAWADYNNDGFLDLYVANNGMRSIKGYFHETNMLYKNNGDGTFTDVVEQSHATGIANCPTRSTSGLPKNFKPSVQPLWFDFNNDNKIDLFIITSWGAVSPLYRNNGDGTFTDVTQLANVCYINDDTLWGNIEDSNNDGYFDIKIYTQYGSYQLINNKNNTFTKTSVKSGISDKDLEMQNYQHNINDILNNSSPEKVLNTINSYQTAGGPWLTIRLIGTKSNKDGIGAAITVQSENITQKKQVESLAVFAFQTSIWPTFKLSKSGIADTIKIQWPSGITQTVTNVKGNQTLTITEIAQ